MNPVFWGSVIVVLLILFAAITMGKTKWRRTPEEQPRGLPRNPGRVSGGDDD
ncbi:MAG TPA: hypothetical protein VL495_09985 [Edaphobacter sp.]|nr:hypothetical protein [Edaphobacter sp.]